VEPLALCAGVRSRNGISYLTVRRFSAQNRLGAIRAVKRLKADPTERETELAAAEVAGLWLLLTGNPGGWTITNVAAGHSGGNSFWRPAWGGRCPAADPRLPAGLGRPADQGRLAPKGIPAAAAARNAGEADRRHPRRR
jgi:hypothetical protein